nr:S9 family peptidase [Bacteroidota bacterium]
DQTGDGLFTIVFKDLKSDQWLNDKILNTTGDPCWANDNSSIFYSIPDAKYRSNKVKKHVLGENSKKDKLIFHEKDSSFDLFVYKSKSGKYIFIRSFSTNSLEFLILDADKPSENFIVFQPRENGLEYSIEHYKDKFYILTNYEATDFRLMETHENKTEKDNWKEVLSHYKGNRLFSMEIFNDFLAVEEMIKGVMQIKILNLKDYSCYYIEFDEEVYSTFISMGPLSFNLNYNTEWLRFNYSSLTTPLSVIEYNMRTKEVKILNRQKIYDNFESTNYESKRLYARTEDDKYVPISIVYKKGTKDNGGNPLLLTAYGAYGGYENLSFSSNILSLLDRGFIYAIAHVRGGEELGRQWYEEGKMMQKMNTFTDFIACAELLIKEGYTKPEKMFAKGHSMGGLLMCTVSNLRPDLFKGIIVNVPYTDVVTSMLDKTSAITVFHYDELGNPKEKEVYNYILSYSPYDNISAKKYPAFLVTTGWYDSFWHGAKFVAKLRKLKTEENPVLLYTNFSAGHSGASGRNEKTKGIAMEYAFIFKLLGIH